MYSTALSLSKHTLLALFLILISVSLQAQTRDWSVHAKDPDVYKTVQDALRKLKTDNGNEIKQSLITALRKNRYLTANVEVIFASNTIRITDEQKYLVIFNGNEKVSDSKIKNAFNLSNVNSSVYSIEEDLRNLILLVYDGLGYNKTKVTSEKKYFQQENIVRLTYEIQEGALAKLGKIKINGFFSRSEKHYVNFLKNRSSSLIKKGGFSRKDFENGINNLITDLKNQGYLDATVSGVQIFEDPKRSNSINVTLDLFEGRATTVENITFIGNQDVESEWLEVLLGLKPGDVIDFYKFEDGLKRIMDYYLSTGYLKAEINPQKKELVQLDSEQRLVDISVEIVEGPKIIVGDIEINGNEKTKGFVIRKSLDFEVGDVLTVNKVKTTRQRLGLLSLFSSADIQFIPQTDKPGHLVRITVEERNPGLVQMGFGVNNQRSLTLKGYTGVLYRNLWGTARAINSRLELQSSFQETDFIEHRAFVSFFEPFIYGTPLSARLTINSSENIFDIVQSSGTEQTTIFSTKGFDMIIENQVNRQFKAAWTVLGFDYIKEYELDNQFDPIREQIAFFGPTIDIDFRNNPVLPTKGFYSRFEGEFAPAFLGTQIESSSSGRNDISFIKMQTSLTHYSDLNENLIWVNTVRGGYLKNFSSGTDLFPKSRAFFLGGANSIRGFDPSDPDERIPSEQDIQGSTSGGLQGGSLLLIPDDSYYYLLKTEFRFPLYKEIWGSFFYDGGAVLISGVDFIDPYRDAAGVGLRFNTPVGAVSAEIGFKLDRKKYRGESPNQFHISIGTF